MKLVNTIKRGLLITSVSSILVSQSALASLTNVSIIGNATFNPTATPDANGAYAVQQVNFDRSSLYSFSSEYSILAEDNNPDSIFYNNGVSFSHTETLILDPFNPPLNVWDIGDFSFVLENLDTNLISDSTLVSGTGTITDHSSNTTATGTWTMSSQELTATLVNGGLGTTLFNFSFSVDQEASSYYTIRPTPELSASVAPASLALLAGLMLMGVERRRRGIKRSSY